MDWNKGSLLEMSGNYWKSCVLHSAVELDVFSIIDDNEKSAEEISETTDYDLRGLTALLNALSAIELLVKTENRYSNVDFSKKFLCKSSPDYTGYIIMHHNHLVTPWANLSDSVVTGKPYRSSVSHSDNKVERESFLMGMFNIASSTAPVYSKKLDFTGCKNLLDLGGGPGTYAIHFCLNMPELNATVFDLPTTRSFAEKTIASFDLSNRIQFIGGNYCNEELGFERVYDLVWLSHILHGQGADTAEKIISRAVKVLKPGGRILIHEFILNDNMDGPVFPALFSLNMLIGTKNGQSYSESQLKKMLGNNGIINIKRINVETPNGAGILSGALP